MPGVCGIGAILDPSGHGPPDAGRRMTEALAHRGPDGHGVVQMGPVTLAHTRLAFIGVDNGEQPLRNEDGTIAAIVNGEIYNYRALRAELQRSGHIFSTETDSEVVVHGYEEHGPDFVRRMNGMFAFALWDADRDRLVAARDPYGVKPLYWHSNGARLALASEIGALLEAGLVRPGVDRVALDHYLACRFVPSPRTLFAGVSKLPPAGLMVAEPGSAPRISTYRSAPGAPHTGLGGPELEAELAHHFTDAVKRQMMSEVPYGAFLSGGVDSAAIVAAMAEGSATPPKTFTIGFPGHGDVLDERRYAADSARAIGTEHHDTAMVEGDFLEELGRCVRHLEEPAGLPSAPALMQLSRFAAQSVKAVLSGQGADEPHGGYGRHQAAAALGMAGFMGPAARPLGTLATRLAGGNERVRRAARLLGDLTPAERLVRLVEITGEDERSRLVGGAGEQAAAERADLAAGVLADVSDRGLVEQALYLDTHLFLPDGLLICADKMSMAASLEQRVPFLDTELMDFVERVPVRERVRLRDGKRLHRAAMARLVPREVVDRPKHGFSTPYEDWLRSSLGEEVRTRYAPGSALSELVDPATVASLVDANAAGRSDHKRVLFCLLELSEWHGSFIES